MEAFDPAIVQTGTSEPKGSSRELQKTNWAPAGVKLESLDDLGDSKEPKFNQFDNKKTTYKDETYTTKINEDNLT